MCPKDYRKLGCGFNGKMYFDNVLVMGCRAEIPDLAWNAFEKMGKLLKNLHEVESKSKACGPCTRMIFLGIVVNTVKMTLEIDKTRLHNLKELLGKWENKTHASLKEVQSLVGVLSFASSCIQQGRAFFSRILNFLREMPLTGKSKIPEDVRKDISWWRYIAPLWNLP